MAEGSSPRPARSGRRRIEEMNAYYEKVAPLHDSFMGYTSNEAMEGLLRPIIEWVEPFIRGKRVLELACGTGNWTQVLSKRALSVTAADQSQSYLSIARSKDFAGHNVTFLRADAYSLESVGGTFEAAFAADWWSHIPLDCITGFVAGIVRKLLPGSSIVILDMLPGPSLDAMFSHYDENGNGIHRRRFEDGTEFEVVKNFPKEEELLEVFEKYSSDMEYREHAALRRWVFTATLR